MPLPPSHTHVYTPSLASDALSSANVRLMTHNKRRNCPPSTVVYQALTKGAKREEPTMRMLRWTMTFLCAIMITLSGITWYQGAIVVDYTNQQAVAIHYMGHRMYYLEVQCACPSDICVCDICASAGASCGLLCLFFLIHKSHSICFIRAQGIPTVRPASPAVAHAVTAVVSDKALVVVTLHPWDPCYSAVFLTRPSRKSHTCLKP